LARTRRQKSLQVHLNYRPSSTALHLLVDSTGIKFLGEGEWKRKKHGAEYRRQWRKVHLGIDAQTLEIRAIEVTDNAIGDAPILPELLAQIPPEEPIDRVSADGAYDTRGCHAAIAQRGTMAVIPPRKNGQPWKKDAHGVQTRNDALRACQRLGFKIWKNWSGYHRRSLVETKIHCFKRLGERVTARTLSVKWLSCIARRLAQPLYAAWPSRNSACGITPSGVWGITSSSGFMQQSPSHA
jgi:hypothetical protein